MTPLLIRCFPERERSIRSRARLPTISSVFPVQFGGGKTYLEGTSIWPDYTLTTFNESFLIPDQSSNLDNIASDIVLKNLDCLNNQLARSFLGAEEAYLRSVHSSSQQLQYIPSFQNDIWIPCLPSRLDSHLSRN